MHSPGKTLLTFALLHSILQGQICLLLQVFLTSYFCIPVLYNENPFWVLVLDGLVGTHRTIQLQLLQCYWWGIGLDFHDIEWFALERNRDHSVILETASKYCILDYPGASFHHSPHWMLRAQLVIE